MSAILNDNSSEDSGSDEKSQFIKPSVNDFDDEIELNGFKEDFSKNSTMPTTKKKNYFNALKEHKHLKQILLLFFLIPILEIPAFLVAVTLPHVFKDIAQYNYPDYDMKEIEAKASYYKSFSDSLPYITLFIFGPIIGILSDRIGRKPVLAFGAVVLILDMIATLITIKTNNLIYHYIMHTIAGSARVAGAVIFTYIADLSDEKDLPFLFSLLGFFLSGGFVLGPIVQIGISKIEVENLQLYVAICISICGFFIIPFFKESLEIAKQSGKFKEGKRATNPFLAIKKLFTSSLYLTLVVILFLFITYASLDVSTLFYYYCGSQYGWGKDEDSLFSGGTGLNAMLWSGVLIPILLKHYSDRKIISGLLVLNVIGHVVLIFSGISQFLFIFGSILSVNVSTNLIQAIVTRNTPAELRATILLGLQSIGSIISFAATFLVNNIYTFSISEKLSVHFPQLAFFIHGIIYSVSFLGSIFIWRMYRNRNGFQPIEATTSVTLKTPDDSNITSIN